MNNIKSLKWREVWKLHFVVFLCVEFDEEFHEIFVDLVDTVEFLFIF